MLFIANRPRALHGGETTSKHLHRLALFNNEGRITCIVSQSDIVRYGVHTRERLLNKMMVVVVENQPTSTTGF